MTNYLNFAKLAAAYKPVHTDIKSNKYVKLDGKYVYYSNPVFLACVPLSLVSELGLNLSLRETYLVSVEAFSGVHSAQIILPAINLDINRVEVISDNFSADYFSLHKMGEGLDYYPKYDDTILTDADREEPVYTYAVDANLLLAAQEFIGPNSFLEFYGVGRPVKVRHIDRADFYVQVAPMYFKQTKKRHNDLLLNDLL